MSKWIVGITGVWMVTMSLIQTTKNTKSAIVFKVIPFFLGLGCILMVFGVI